MMRDVAGMTAVRRLVPRVAGMCIAVAGVLAYTRFWLPAALAGADGMVWVDLELLQAEPAWVTALRFVLHGGMVVARLLLPLALLAVLTDIVVAGLRRLLGVPTPEPWEPEAVRELRESGLAGPFVVGRFHLLGGVVLTVGGLLAGEPVAFAIGIWSTSRGWGMLGDVWGALRRARAEERSR